MANLSSYIFALLVSTALHCSSSRSITHRLCAQQASIGRNRPLPSPFLRPQLYENHGGGSPRDQCRCLVALGSCACWRDGTHRPRLDDPPHVRPRLTVSMTVYEARLSTSWASVERKWNQDTPLIAVIQWPRASAVVVKLDSARFNSVRCETALTSGANSHMVCLLHAAAMNMRPRYRARCC